MKYFNVTLIFLTMFFIESCNNNDESNFIEESGTIETTSIILSAQVSGTALKQYFNEGDKISAGDTLLKIDDELLQIQLKQAESGRIAAEAKYNLVRKGSRDEDINVVNQTLIQAQANYDLAKADYERFKVLFESNSITQKQFQEIETRFNIAQSQLRGAEESFSKIKNISRPEEIKQAEANYLNSVANVDLIKKRIRDSYIISPINGFIVKKFFEVGETIGLGASTFMIADLSKVNLVVYVSETNLGNVKLGQVAEIKTDTFKDKVYKGKVIFISPEAEFTPKNIQTKDERTKLVFAVKIEIPNTNFELKAGMPADAKIIL